MKNCWQNIEIDNSIVVSEEIKFTKSELLKVFKNSLNTKKWKFVKWIYTKNAPYQCLITDGKDYIDILLYLKNISNAGWEDKPHIKRVQVSNPKELNLEFNRYDDLKKLSLIIGYYNYSKPVFVSWNAYEFRRHKTNRSCYVEINDLIAGYKNGYYNCISSRQEIDLFTPDNFNLFLENKFQRTKSELNNIGDKLYDITMEYYNIINKFDNYWDGKEKILEMKNNNGKNWKQIEWPGFYFEFLMQKILEKEKFFKVRFGNTKFDMFDYIPWDLKVHSINGSSSNKIIANDFESIRKSVETYGKQGFIILEGESVYEEDGKFRIWHNELKGKTSVYQKRNQIANKPHRRRKKAFKLVSVTILVFDKDDLCNHPQFQEGFINSNGHTRKPKMIIDKKHLTKKNIILQKELKD